MSKETFNGNNSVLNEYISTLREQIRNKHAKELVTQEIMVHIEEQAEEFEHEGLSKNEALAAAVREMGDPVETGRRLDSIHKPHFPWSIFLIVIGMSLVSTIMQILYSIVIDEKSLFVVIDNLYESLFLSSIGIIIITAVIFWNYTHLFNNTAAVTIIFFLLYLMACRAGDSHGESFIQRYQTLTLMPILFPCYMYKNRNKGLQGTLKCLFSIFTLFAGVLLIDMNYGEILCTAAIIENIIIAFIVLIIGFAKRLFALTKKELTILCASGTLAFIIIAAAATLYNPHIIYRIADRIAVMQNSEANATESNYQNSILQESATNISFMGNKTLASDILASKKRGEFMLHDIFSYFGLFVGMLVIGVIGYFLIQILQIVLHQSNRMSYLLGVTCVTGLIIRFSSYIIVNLGFGVIYTTSVPFFNYDFYSILTNSVFIGLLCCIERNTMIIGEQKYASMPVDGR